MKYRDLIQFDPIKSVIVLRSADDQKKAEELIRSHVMSDDKRPWQHFGDR